MKFQSSLYFDTVSIKITFDSLDEAKEFHQEVKQLLKEPHFDFNLKFKAGDAAHDS